MPRVEQIPNILTCDVAEGPDCLLAHVHIGRGEECDEVRDSARLHHELGLLRGAGGDVGQGPRSLEGGEMEVESSIFLTRVSFSD